MLLLPKVQFGSRPALASSPAMTDVWLAVAARCAAGGVVQVSTKLPPDRPLLQDVCSAAALLDRQLRYAHPEVEVGSMRCAVQAFKDGDVRFLICTDVAARGIDISGLPYVINMTLPDKSEDYIHRCVRARALPGSGVASAPPPGPGREVHQG